MIKIEKIKVEGWEPAIRGMRNPLDSWEKSDSLFYDYSDELYSFYHDICGKTYRDDELDSELTCKILPSSVDPSIYIGPNDLNLMMKLAKSGTEHAKYRRMIVVWMDITAPLYWWKEFDTYKVGTVADSCSTMHTIHKREFTLDDFSCEHLGYYNAEKNIYEKVEPVMFNDGPFTPTDQLQEVIDILNMYRKTYLATKEKRYWWQLIQLLPSSYIQKRTVMVNYEALANMYRQRRNHKLDEWHEFCDMIELLPYSQLITFKGEMEKDLAENLRNDGVPEEDIPGAVEHIKWFLTPPEKDEMSNEICDLVMNNASESDIKEAVERSMWVMYSKKRIEEIKSYLEEQRKILQKNYDDAVARGETWISVDDVMKGSMFEPASNTLANSNDGFVLSSETKAKNLTDLNRLVDITKSGIEDDFRKTSELFMKEEK